MLAAVVYQEGAGGCFGGPGGPMAEKTTSFQGAHAEGAGCVWSLHSMRGQCTWYLPLRTVIGWEKKQAESREPTRWP